MSSSHETRSRITLAIGVNPGEIKGRGRERGKEGEGGREGGREEGEREGERIRCNYGVYS